MTWAFFDLVFFCSPVRFANVFRAFIFDVLGFKPSNWCVPIFRVDKGLYRNVTIHVGRVVLVVLVILVVVVALVLHAVHQVSMKFKKPTSS